MTVTISHGAQSAVVAARGAQLISWKQQGRELLWSGDPTHWGYSAPVLFPIIGTQAGSPMKQHGFARLSDFSVEAQDANRVELALRANDETRALYPHEFILRVRYTLTDDGLETAFQVENPSDIPLPYMIGGHPAFALEAALSEYTLAFAAPEDRRVALEYPLFYDSPLLYPELKSRSVRLIHEASGRGIEMTFAPFDLLVVWQPKDAPFLCLEPMMGSMTLNPKGCSLHAYHMRAL